MSHNDTFSPVHWKTSEIKRKLSSVKSAELFALDYGAGQLCYLKELYRNFSTTLHIDVINWLSNDNWLTQICPTYFGQNTLVNVKKCVDQVGITIRFEKTSHNLADPLTKKIKDHDINVMAARPMHSQVTFKPWPLLLIILVFWHMLF